MSAATPARDDLAALNALLDAALALPPQQQEAFLAGLPPQQATLAERARLLLLEWRDPSRSAFLRDGAAIAAQTAADDMAAGDAADGGIGASGAQAGDRVGAYRLVERLGAGGMGDVWLARRDDGIFDREVAVKLPRIARRVDIAERMALERRIGARLEHPNIARLYDAGVTDAGQPYLVMERLRGRDIVAYAREHGLDARARVALIVQACDAVAHAHRQLIVHRDIKPSNLWVDDSGQVKLLDFGIARQLGPDLGPAASIDSHTRTPRYAAPEQSAAGGLVTTASDLYSLGVVLLELLTGQTQQRDPERLALDPSLRAILARALAARAEDRYTSADGFADDLRRWRADVPPHVADLPGRWLARLAWRRHRVLAMAGAALALVIATSAAVGWVQWQRERLQAQRTEQVRDFLAGVLEDAEPLADGKPVTAREMVERALERVPASFASEPALRGQVLTSLGFVMQRLGEYERAGPLLIEAIDLLASTSGSDPAFLQFARAQRAAQLHRLLIDSDPVQAERLANEVVRESRGRQGSLYVKADGLASAVLAAIASQRRDFARAIEQYDHVIDAHMRVYGPAHTETALAIAYQAVMMISANRFADADRTLARAEKVLATLAVRDEDQRNIEFARARLDGWLGRAARSRQGFERLVDRPPSLYTSAQIRRLLANQMAALGDLASADAMLAALPAIEPGWEAETRAEVQARVAARLGDDARARRALRQMQEQLDVLEEPADSAFRLEAVNTACVVDLLAGHPAAAQARLEPVIAALGSRTDPVEAARALDMMGLSLARQGHPREAVEMHQRAGRSWRTAFGNDHPAVARNDLWIALARTSRDGPADPGIARALATLMSTWPRPVEGDADTLTGRDALQRAWID